MVFWTDTNSSSSFLKSCTMMGTNMTTLPPALPGIRPIGLAIDVDTQSLYLLDQYTTTIWTCGYDGSNFNVFYQGQADTTYRSIALSAVCVPFPMIYDSLLLRDFMNLYKGETSLLLNTFRSLLLCTLFIIVMVC